MDTMTTNDNGVDFLITITENDAIVDISGASVSVEFKRPDGSTLTRAAVLNGDGTDGKMLYQSTQADFTENFAVAYGVWQYRPIVFFTATSTQFGGQEWAEFELLK